MPIRKIGVISRTYRHINRYRGVIAILVKCGFILKDTSHLQV